MYKVQQYKKVHSILWPSYVIPSTEFLQNIMYIQYLAVISRRIMSHYVVPVILTKHTSHNLIFKIQRLCSSFLQTLRLKQASLIFGCFALSAHIFPVSIFLWFPTATFLRHCGDHHCFYSPLESHWSYVCSLFFLMPSYEQPCLYHSYLFYSICFQNSSFLCLSVSLVFFFVLCPSPFGDFFCLLVPFLTPCLYSLWV